jgi:hypothetical protein
MKTMRLPSAELALTVTAAVNVVPFPLTTMFETVTVVSVVPLAVMNLIAVVPDRPIPFTVRVTELPRVILPGLRLSMCGPLVAETALTPANWLGLFP